MVTTRRGSTTSHGPDATPNRKFPSKAAAGKKHKDIEEDVIEEPKKKAKSTTTTTPKKGHKKGAKHREEGEEDEERAQAKRAGKKATVEEVDDADGGGKRDVAMKDSASPKSKPAVGGADGGIEHDTEMKESASPKTESVSVSDARDQKVEKSPILEKGLVYFFLRGKVNVERPESMDEVKRSYMVLRPLPQGAQLVGGKKLEDTGENRLIAIPKKRLPKRGEKFLTFVEEPSASLEELRSYLKGRTYQTKTVGERTDFPAQPVGEGIYAIAKSDNERQSHFVYMLTIPEKPSELQQDLGLQEKGSFVISVRNPKTPAPPNAGIPEPAKYSQDIIDELKGLRWGSVQPKHFVKNAEFLFIGEKNFPQQGEHEGTADEMNLLSEEDEKRVAHLNGNESVFADLELSKKEFVGIQTTWGIGS